MTYELREILEESLVRGKCECPNCHQLFPYDKELKIDFAITAINKLERKELEEAVNTAEAAKSELRKVREELIEARDEFDGLRKNSNSYLQRIEQLEAQLKSSCHLSSVEEIEEVIAGYFFITQAKDLERKERLVKDCSRAIAKLGIQKRSLTRDRKELEEAVNTAEVAKQEMRKMNEENERLKNNKFTYCAYCGQEFEIEKNGAIEEVNKHIYQCDKHPIADFRKEIDSLQAQLKSTCRLPSQEELVTIIQNWYKENGGELNGAFARTFATVILKSLEEVK